jgi:hypothetical protein
MEKNIITENKDVLKECYYYATAKKLFLDEYAKTNIESYMMSDNDISYYAQIYVLNYASEEEKDNYVKYLFKKIYESKLQDLDVGLYCYHQIIEHHPISNSEYTLACHYFVYTSGTQRNEFDNAVFWLRHNQLVGVDNSTHEKFMEKKMLERKQFLYYLADSLAWNITAFRKYTDKYLPYAKVIDLITDYGINCLHLSEEDMKHKFCKVPKNDSKSKLFFDSLLTLQNSEEIINLFKNQNPNLKKLLTAVSKYSTIYYPTKHQEIEIKLVKKIKIYLDYLENEEAKLKAGFNVTSAEKLVSKYIESTKSNVYDFIYTEGLTSDKFIRAVNIVKENNSKLYQEFKTKFGKHDLNKTMLHSCAEYILEACMNGIPEENNRPIDLLDINNMEFSSEQLIGILKTGSFSGKYLGKNKIKAINMVYNKKHSERKETLNIMTVYSSVEEFNCKKDKQGFPTPGTGTVISNEDKDYLIRWLADNNQQVNLVNYEAAISRYKKGYITIPKKKTRKRTSNC